MRKPPRRYRRSIPFGTYLLLTVIGLAIAGAVFMHFNGKRSIMSEAPAPETKFEAVPLETLCARLVGKPLPEDAAIRRQPDGAVAQMQGANLSAHLEQNPHFRTLQQPYHEEEMALCFLHAYGSVFKLDDPLRELRGIGTDLDTNHQATVRFGQSYANRLVRDGEITVYLNPEKQVIRVEGRYHPSPSTLKLKAKINTQQATQTVREALLQMTSEPHDYRLEEAIYYDRQSRPLLAYRIVAYNKTSGDWEFWLDANTGRILERMPPRK